MKSRFYVALPMKDRSNDSMIEAMSKLIKPLPNTACKSFTSDRGKEFACYKEIEKLGIDFYFADPYSAWQKGSNENSNGLLREYYPKKTDLAKIDTEKLTEEQLEIYDLLIAGKKLTQAEENRVKISARNLYNKLVDNRSRLLVVDWYKDEQPRAKLKYEVELSLNHDLPKSYDKASFDSKVSLLMNHFVDMAVQGYGWIGSA